MPPPAEDSESEDESLNYEEHGDDGTFSTGKDSGIPKDRNNGLTYLFILDLQSVDFFHPIAQGATLIWISNNLLWKW